MTILRFQISFFPIFFSIADSDFDELLQKLKRKEEKLKILSNSLRNLKMLLHLKSWIKLLRNLEMKSQLLSGKID